MWVCAHVIYILYVCLCRCKHILIQLRASVCGCFGLVYTDTHTDCLYVIHAQKLSVSEEEFDMYDKFRLAFLLIRNGINRNLVYNFSSKIPYQIFAGSETAPIRWTIVPCCHIANWDQFFLGIFTVWKPHQWPLMVFYFNLLLRLHTTTAHVIISNKINQQNNTRIDVSRL